jgi:hypothetical protein
MMRHYLLLALILTFSACTERGYPGPERPAAEISVVTLNKVGEFDLENIRFDDRTLSGIGDNIQLLPGDHKFSIDYSTEEYEYCDKKDFLCLPTVTRGICEGNITTKAGRKYLVTIENRNTLIGIHLAAKSYYDFSERQDETNFGSASCHQTTPY